VLGQEATDEKSNEITAIPALLKRLDISGCLITLDAMGTQKNIARQVIDGDGDYLLAVKGNQGTLHADIRTFFQQPPQTFVIDEYSSVEKNHGRLEQRRCRICTDIDWLRQRQDWQGLTAIVEVALTVEQKGTSTTYYRYYISSLAMTAKAALYAVRSHWGIENKLHWVLDVIFKEDQARTRSGNGSKNMEIVRHIITNLLRQVAGNASLKVKRKKAAWSVDFLEKVLRQAA
jgi:predicted transposase YbfD/YdcC